MLTDDYDYIWLTLLKKDLNDYYNLIITLKIFENFFKYKSDFSKIEKIVYGGKKEFEIYFLIIKTLEKILSQNFNEMIKTDLDIISKKNIWTSINLDSLYFIKLPHLNLHKFCIKKKNPELYEIILTINIVVTTLERLEGCYFYTKLKKKEEGCYPEELLNSISFTKGYLICFAPEISNILKNYKYPRKNILKNPIKIPYFKNINFESCLTKSVLRDTIWMNDGNLMKTSYERVKIFNIKLLKKKTKFKICISVINFLNSIELEYNREVFNNIYQIISSYDNIHHTLSNKNALENVVLKINSDNDNFTEVRSDLSTLVQSASVLELIKKQIEIYPKFFLDHRLDHRLRIYCYPWPINYQLNHIVRNVLFFSKDINFVTILENFYNHPLIKKYNKNKTIFTFDSNIFTKNLVDSFFKKNNFSGVGEVLNLKKECFYQTMLKYGGGDDMYRLITNISLIEDFTKSTITKDWDIWLKKFNIKKKKLAYLVSYHKQLCDMMNDRWTGLFWADASSNAIQLIVFRLGLKNELLLKLVNIVDNDTGFSNIYEYLCESIKLLDHKEFLKGMGKLTHEQLVSLQDVDLNKYLLMPSSYGMGKFSYREKLSEMIKSDERFEIWQKLEDREKIQISDYFWECASEVLKKLSFDIDEYKGICKFFWERGERGDEPRAFIWKNDLGITIAPVSLKKSNRDYILKKINELKLKIKENLSNEENDLLLKRLITLKKKLERNDKDYWKRSMIKGCSHKIFSRIYFKKKYEINHHETRQSLIPNTIHAYDASNMHLCVQICKKLNIEILVIHDSIGCHPLLLPLVKTIFKIANILILDMNSKRKVFPLPNNPKYSFKNSDVTQLDELFDKIIKSKNFFK